MLDWLGACEQKSIYSPSYLPEVTSDLGQLKKMGLQLITRKYFNLYSCSFIMQAQTKAQEPNGVNDFDTVKTKAVPVRVNTANQ